MILLNPGPVTLSPAVRQALQGDDLCHREPEFAALTLRICQKLQHVYPEAAANYQAVLLTASGSGGVEAMLSTFAPVNGCTLVLSNGVYGERMLAMLQAQGKPCLALSQRWGEAIDLSALAIELARQQISHVAVVHHETTTGRLNELDAVAALCREKGVALLIDAVSSFGGEWLDFAGWQPLAVAATANKCLHGIPGVAFVLARQDALAQPSHATSLYLDLLRYYRDQRQGWSPFTQAVQGFMALDAALDELQMAGGWLARRQQYRQRSAAVAETLAQGGVSPLLAAELCSSMLRTYHLPPGMSYAYLHDQLKAAGFVIYAGQGSLAAEVFRIATMGEITAADLQALQQALRQILAAGVCA